MTEEQQLIASSRSGDPEAFRRIVELYKDGVMAVAFSRVRDPDDAEDVAQVTFVETEFVRHFSNN